MLVPKMSLMGAGQTFTTVFDMVAQMYQDRGEDEVMITPYQLALQIIDWADPQKCADK